MSDRVKRFEKAGLLGCFDGTGVNSENYKEVLSGNSAPEWISINEGPPDEGKWVLIGGKNIQSVDHGCRLGDCYYMHGELDKKMLWATHWMPLPEPPK